MKVSQWSINSPEVVFRDPEEVLRGPYIPEGSRDLRGPLGSKCAKQFFVVYIYLSGGSS